ncbi:MAG: winged helix-turn-helix domain-containing protein [Acidobacteria bacterium]|nr:winged helix-turn-helix domain-containing protein [Acidobacteriota bacterium]
MLQPGAHPRSIRFGVYEVDVRSRELRKQGIKLRIQEQPFQVLCMLLEKPGELVTREELRQKLWPSDTFVDFDHSLNTAINKLREALSDSAANPRYIETLARRGYRFVGPPPAAMDPEFPPAQDDAQPPGGSGDAGAESEEPGEPPLPAPPRIVVRTLFGLSQALYLGLYILALAELEQVYRLATYITAYARAVETAVLIVAGAGVPVRLYLLTAVAFDYGASGLKFHRIFPLVLALDFAWALTPYLLMHKMGTGLATAACAALLYLPFSERTLIRMGYGATRQAG